MFFLIISLTLILIRFANQSARFISVYGDGLTGAQVSWANRQYHSHHTLPLEMVAQIKQSIVI